MGRRSSLRPRRLVAAFCIAWLVLLGLLATPALAFTDVPDSHRYARAINELAQLGIMSGMGDGTFRPNDPVYRAQFAKMMCGLLEIDVGENQSFAPFHDLGPDDLGDLYPHEFVGAAYQAGITRGKTPTTFAPYTNITLPQVITMVVRAADAYYPGLLTPPPHGWPGCWPDTDPDHGANLRRADYSDLLAFLPIRSRWSDVLRPATRGEVSQILANLLSRLDNEAVAITFEGAKLNFPSPPYAEANRYYLPLIGFIQEIGGQVTASAGRIHLDTSTVRVDLDPSAACYTLGQRQFPLRNHLPVRDGQVYVSLFDLHRMLGLKVFWDEAQNSIALYWDKTPVVPHPQAWHGKPALLRFEDITAAQRYATPESLEKLRCIFDYCYERGIPMHLGWVPRCIDPSKGIDNDPADDSSMHNANFVYTLDHFLDRNGLIGLHGYTHQYGSETSIDGTEFSCTRITSESSIRGRVQQALSDAQRLDIPIAFFETPHYAATPYQQALIGQYFDVLYEPRAGTNQTHVSRVTYGDRVVTFIPTPLGYIYNLADTNNMLSRIRSLRQDDLASLFYHPSLEFGFIGLVANEDGFLRCEYATDSPLHRVINTLGEQGYAFVNVYAF